MWPCGQCGPGRVGGWSLHVHITISRSVGCGSGRNLDASGQHPGASLSPRSDSTGPARARNPFRSPESLGLDRLTKSFVGLAYVTRGRATLPVMNGLRSDLEPQRRHTTVVRRAVAAVVLVAVVALTIHLIVGLVMAVFWFVVVIAAVAAVLWSLKTLVW